MLSTNSPSGIQRRQTQHRRQNSTPAAFEAPQVRPLPATNIQQRRQQRTGMSLDLRGLDLGSLTMPSPAHHQDHTFPGSIHTIFQQTDSTVSNTNTGQPSQHNMQVAQPHSMPQPGPQDPFLQSPVQFSHQPRTSLRTIRPLSPRQQKPLSPAKVPSDKQLKELREHIQSVYGSCGQVFINILPSPSATPQKTSQHEPLDTAPLSQTFSNMANINLQPTPSAMTFDFENPEMDMGYDSSSHYTSDAVSPSPASSPRQKAARMYLQGIKEDTQEVSFSQPPHFPTSSSPISSHGLPLSASLSQPMLLPELELDASLEYTGISPEEVQRYISDQDPSSNKWTCLYPECGKVFGRRENIRSHVQTHLGDRQFKCNGCGKCFVRQHDLKRHAKIHSGNKPYKCPCGAGFARQDALTRHRQRGMCIGGFADAVRRQAKRGRPKKNRPEMEERVAKANKTRQALTTAPSSESAGSPGSDMRSSPPPFEDYMKAQPLRRIMTESSSFSENANSSSDPFSFDSVSSPYVDNTNTNDTSFASTTSYAGEVTHMNLLQHLSPSNQTPPMSPAEHQPNPSSSTDAKEQRRSSPLKDCTTPSRASTKSNPFTTPPSSPAEPRNELEELFDGLPDNSCSQFEMEMKAMDDFSSLDDFLDFTG